MSGAMENRAAVFTSQPQDVEVFQRGAWRPGALLGWRHGRDGSCEMWVRTAGAGAEETTWLGLDAVRLPEPEPEPEPEPQRHLTLAASTVAPDVPAPSELTATMNLFAVRDLLAEDGEAQVRSRRPGGRRRAPEAVDEGAPAAGRTAPAPSSPAGRHRAPGSPGRHRAADSGVLPAIADDSWVPPPDPAASAAPLEPDVDLYTRPMRLVDQVAQSRRPRWDGSRGGMPPLR